MKKNYFLCGCILLFVGCGLLGGCDKEDESQVQEPQLPEKGCIILSPESEKSYIRDDIFQMDFAPSAQQKVLSFTADTTWTLYVESVEWMSVRVDSIDNNHQVVIKQDGTYWVLSGEGSEEPYNIYFQTTQNEEPKSRKAQIILQANYFYFNNPEGKPFRYSGEIVQYASLFTQHEVYVKYWGGSGGIMGLMDDGRMDVSYEQTSLADWIHVDGISYYVDANNSNAKREGKIFCIAKDYFTDAGHVLILGMDTLTIIQDYYEKVEMRINVSTAGSLHELIPDTKKYEITELTLSGNLNGDDIRYIREMAGIDYAGERTEGKLVYLDLLEANIVSGGKVYNDVYHTTNDEIGLCMFEGCQLFSIILPRSITYCNNYSFDGCYNLTSISIPNSVTSMGSSVFINCTNLTTIELPSELESIGFYFFQRCTNLTSIKIQDKVTSILDHAFRECYELAEITLPSSIEFMGEGVFEGCQKLDKIHCQAIEPPLCKGESGIEEQVTLYVPKGTVDKYKNAAVWKKFKEIVEE